MVLSADGNYEIHFYESGKLSRILSLWQDSIRFYSVADGGNKLLWSK